MIVPHFSFIFSRIDKCFPFSITRLKSLIFHVVINEMHTNKQLDEFLHNFRAQSKIHKSIEKQAFKKFSEK